MKRDNICKCEIIEAYPRIFEFAKSASKRILRQFSLAVDGQNYDLSRRCESDTLIIGLSCAYANKYGTRGGERDAMTKFRCSETDEKTNDSLQITIGETSATQDSDGKAARDSS